MILEAKVDALEPLCIVNFYLWNKSYAFFGGFFFF
jgi:hypothetical protein